MEKIRERYETIVIGGGLAGVCAAIASARHGCKTCLVQDRPVLGGNSSREIRVAIGGADYEFRFARETGILEEMRVEDRKRNYEQANANGSPNYIWDTVLLEKVRAEKNLTLHLNTHVFEVRKRKRIIRCVRAVQLGSEKFLEIHGDIFVDATGDGTIAAEAGASYRFGRERQKDFGEDLAPEKADDKTMGSTLLFHWTDRGRLVRFTPPAWAHDYPDDDSLNGRDHSYRGPYAWMEYGGDDAHEICDNEKIRDELLKIVYGVWDHLKNHGNHLSDNLELDWVSAVPGKRESRRIAGDYILKQSDIEQRILHEDRVAYGGWPIDLHSIGGFRVKATSTLLPLSGPFSIPFGCYCAKDIDNLMMAGRDISATHVAFATARVMATCAVGGQAVGTAASLCRKYGVLPKKVRKEKIRELQQTLLRDDAYLIGLKNEDKDDLALHASLNASSSMKLEIDGPGEKYETDVQRAQVIHLTGTELALTELRLKNETAGTKKVRLMLVPADKRDRIYGEECVRDLSKDCIIRRRVGTIAGQTLSEANATIGPRSDEWVSFSFEKGIKPGTYWLILYGEKGVFWMGTNETVPGLSAAYEIPGVGWLRLRRTIYRVRVFPASHPFGPTNANNGVARPEMWPNIWISDPAESLPQYLDVNFNSGERFNAVYLTFDTNLDVLQRKAPFPETIKDYDILAKISGKWIIVAGARDNYLRRRIHRFPGIKTDAIRILVKATNGSPEARIYEVRVYNEEGGKRRETT